MNYWQNWHFSLFQAKLLPLNEWIRLLQNYPFFSDKHGRYVSQSWNLRIFLLPIRFSRKINRRIKNHFKMVVLKGISQNWPKLTHFSGGIFFKISTLCARSYAFQTICHSVHKSLMNKMMQFYYRRKKGYSVVYTVM